MYNVIKARHNYHCISSTSSISQQNTWEIMDLLAGEIKFVDLWIVDCWCNFRFTDKAGDRTNELLYMIVTNTIHIWHLTHCESWPILACIVTLRDNTLYILHLNGIWCMLFIQTSSIGRSLLQEQDIVCYFVVSRTMYSLVQRLFCDAIAFY
jgi:hypothetical protein